MPKLYLIPNTISNENFYLLPDYIGRKIADVRTFFVEEPKSARRLLKNLNLHFPLDQCHFYDLSEHTTLKEIKEYIKILQKTDGGVISEAGCPCVADPGSDLVLLCHQHGIDIIPLVGPSSIIMALMASGLNGQNFAFNGYLPRDHQERKETIKDLQERSLKERQTQIFMEAPYRNQNLLEDVLAVCYDTTCLCVACNITAQGPMIKTMKIKEWKNARHDFNKKPALFLIDASQG